MLRKKKKEQSAKASFIRSVNVKYAGVELQYVQLWLDWSSLAIHKKYSGVRKEHITFMPDVSVTRLFIYMYMYQKLACAIPTVLRLQSRAKLVK